MACEYFGDIYTANRFCGFCDSLYFKDEKLRTVERKTTEKLEVIKKATKKDKVQLYGKVCEVCKCEFTQKRKNLRYCGNTCRAKAKIIASNARWVNSEPSTYKPGGQRVANSFFAKKYGVSNRFNVCRG